MLDQTYVGPEKTQRSTRLTPPGRAESDIRRHVRRLRPLLTVDSYREKLFPLLESLVEQRKTVALRH